MDFKGGSILMSDGFKDLSTELLLPNGKMRLLPASKYHSYDWADLRYFLHQYARYNVPTIELVDYLKEKIGDREAIEIGAGAGDLGYHLNIKMTDNKQQEFPDVKKAYEAMGQPTIKYPDDVECIDALDAVIKYKPKVVVASWITPYSKFETTFGSNPYGVKEDRILKLVDTFIIVGNLATHWDKPIRQFTHKTVHTPWLVSRAKDQHKNCIFIWDKSK